MDKLFSVKMSALSLADKLRNRTAAAFEKKNKETNVKIENAMNEASEYILKDYEKKMEKASDDGFFSATLIEVSHTENKNDTLDENGIQTKFGDCKFLDLIFNRDGDNLTTIIEKKINKDVTDESSRLVCRYAQKKTASGKSSWAIYVSWKPLFKRGEEEEESSFFRSPSVASAAGGRGPGRGAGRGDSRDARGDARGDDGCDRGGGRGGRGGRATFSQSVSQGKVGGKSAGSEGI